MKATLTTLLLILLLAGGYYVAFYEPAPDRPIPQSSCETAVSTNDETESLPEENSTTTVTDTNLSNMSEEMRAMVKEANEIKADIIEELRETRVSEHKDAATDDDLETSLKETDEMVAAVNEKEGINGEAIKAEIEEEYANLQSDQNMPEDLKKEVEESENTMLEVEQMMDELNIQVEE